MTDRQALTALAQQVLAAQPFSGLIGTELVSIAEGSVVLQIPVKPQLLQQHGFVHGGVLSYAADNAITFAGGSVLGPVVVTSEYKINYLRPAIGPALRIEARVIGSGKRQAVCSCDIYVVGDGDPKLCAVAFGTVSMLDARSS